MNNKHYFEETLTPREMVILRRLSEDRSNAEIASIETLAVSSVKWYVQNICRKLGAKNRRQAVTRGRDLGYLESIGPAMNGQQSLSTHYLAPGIPSLITLEKERHNLPRQRTSFIGREDSIALVKKWLDECPLVTLTGSGGIGKTRLSIQVAEEVLYHFPDGAWLVELAEVTDPGLVVKSIATILGLQEEISRPIQDTLLNYLRKKSTLIILDNCEHLLETCARLADLILNTCPGVRILATSREPLNVSGEKIYRVPSMLFPDPQRLTDLAALQQSEAVRLFAERTQTRLSGFVIRIENAHSIAQICQRLDGIPLAIELAAARMNVLSIEQLAGRLDDAFRLLTGGTRTALPRQQTLQAAIDWSYQLLNQDEKMLLRQLAVFSGSFDLEAAEAVCDFGTLEVFDVGIRDKGDILDLLSSLVNKSLVNPEIVPIVGMRYRLLEIVRQFAREKLFDLGESQRLRDRHLDYFVALTERGEPYLISKERLEWTKRLKTDVENIQEALAWAYQNPDTAQKGLRIVAAVASRPFWFKGFFREDIDWLQKGLALCEGQAVPPTLEAKICYVMTELYMFLKDVHNRMVWSEKCIQLCRVIGSPADVELSLALWHYGSCYAKVTKDYVLARVWKDESVLVARGLGPKGVFFLALALNARVKYAADPQQGYRDALESYQLFHQSGDRWRTALPLWHLGYYAEMQNDFPAALKHYSEALSVSEEIEDPKSIAPSVLYLGRLYRKLSDFDRAIAYHLEFIRIWNRMGGWERLADGFVSLAIDGYCRMLNRLEHAETEQDWQECLIRVTMLVAVADKQRIYDYEFMLDQDQALLDQALETAKGELGEKIFQTAWERGQSMNQDDAVAVAYEIAADTTR